jgi:hypothetical protein
VDECPHLARSSRTISVVEVKRAEPAPPPAHPKQKDEAKFQPFKVGTALITMKEAVGEEDAVSSLVIVEYDSIDDDIFSGLSQNERITLSAIIELDKARVTTKEIVDAVNAKRGKDSTSSVKNTWLPKLLERNFIERVEEGVYTLPEFKIRLVKPEDSATEGVA